MTHCFSRQILATSAAVSEVSELQMINSVSAVWESLREEGRDAMGEACVHHHCLLADLDVSWPYVEASAPAYWSVLDSDDEQHAIDAAEWVEANRAGHNYGFMAVVMGATDLDLRVVFVTTDETESVVFKTGFG